MPMMQVGPPRPSANPFGPAAMFSPMQKYNRVMRRPQHRFHLRTRPFVIQPFLTAPVLAGETLRNLLMQSRVVTDPVRSPLIGWWKEYYFFYCKLSQIQATTELTDMLIDWNKDMSSFADSGVKWTTYNCDTGVKYTEMCRDKVVSKYFRDEGLGETHSTAAGLVANGTPAENVPLCWVGFEDWTQSLYQNDKYLDGTGDDVGESWANIMAGTVDTSDAGQSDDPVTFAGKLRPDTISDLMWKWEVAKLQNLTKMTFEDYLRQEGIDVPSTLDIDRPELIRYVKQWQYPSNTIDPADGSPVSAVSWVFQERADKDRFFVEPGFIFGVTVCRPKVYKREQDGGAVGLLKSAATWLPQSLRHNPDSSWVVVASSDGPYLGLGENYRWDSRDLFLYGDQFLNFDPSSITDVSAIDAIPGAAQDPGFANRYPDLVDLKALFVDESNDVLTRVREDGVVALNIAGRVEETSP